MKTVISKDGTPIAFDQSGEGAPIIQVVGAFNSSSTGAPLAATLSEHFTVFNYDRRGRGESGDTPPYAIEREIEDLAALITEAGGSASVFGYSSGAVLALKAKAAGLAISRLALYEPPFLVDEGLAKLAQDIPARLTKLLSEGLRGEAVELYQTEMVGIPAEIVAQLRRAPFRPALENIAHTLVYDATILGDMEVVAQQLPSITVPTLMISGGNSQVRMRSAAQTLADALPNAQHRRLPGQTSALIHFSELVELKQKPPFLAQTKDQKPLAPDYSNLIFVENPDYQNEEPIRALAPVSVLVTREEGLFPFARQVIWNIRNEEEWPCLLYRVRYVFEVDPLEQVRDRRSGRLYYQQEGWEEPDTRYYYCWDDVQELTAQELVQMGISLP